MSRAQNITIGCVLGGMATLGLLVCGGLGGLMWFGMVVYEDEVCAHLGAQPAVTETIGEVLSCEVLVMESGDIRDPDTFIFRLEGDAASGRAYVQSTSTGPDATEEYQGILLVSGRQRVLIEGREPPTE
jgi:hypothetical protein